MEIHQYVATLQEQWVVGLQQHNATLLRQRPVGSLSTLGSGILQHPAALCGGSGQ